MSHTVADALAAVEQLWPAAGAEPWDEPGLVSGDAAAAVAHVRLVVDVTGDTVADAIEAGADLVVAHHPLLLRGVTTVRESTYKGAMLARLIRGGVALVTAHTNADVVATGTSAVVARLLGLDRVAPLDGAGDTGIGRTGRLAQPMTLAAFAALLDTILPETAGGVRVAGDPLRTVQSIALCAGAGDAFLDHPAVLAADVYVTSDLRHHPASAAAELSRIGGGPALVDVSHWASEWLWLAQAAAELRVLLPDAVVSVSDVRTDPWDFIIVHSTPEEIV